MPLPVSQKFDAAQAGDANVPSAMVQLLLGNYASSPGYGATATADNATANWPAAGAIDGDRTELNAGAASGADNDVGQSVWQSTSIPDTGAPVSLYVNFNATRVINRIKLYHFSGHGLLSYTLSWWNGSTWVIMALTSDQAPSGNQVSIVTTGTLDVVDFPDITTTQIRVNVFHTQVTDDTAYVTEIEAYRKVDISSRVKSIQVKRQRDYKLGNPLAADITLKCSNDDRFFSFSHAPTADEAAAGFVNAELSANIGLLISLGFNYYQNVELVQVFTGFVDRISVNSKNREATLDLRDGMKPLINNIDSSKLKTTIDIGSAILYVLNRANVSTFETAIDPTGINIDYFFSDTEDQLTTIRDLVQAAGDSLFYFDENGIATYRFFSTATFQGKVWTSQADFNAGTLLYVDTATIPDSVIYLYPGWNASTAGWTSAMPGGGTFTNDSDGLWFQQNAGSSITPAVADGYAYRANSFGNVGTWHTKFRFNNLAGAQTTTAFDFVFLAQTLNVSGDNFIGTGYVVECAPHGGTGHQWTIIRANGGGSTTNLATDDSHPVTDGSIHDLVVTRTLAGLITVILDGVQIMQVTDATYGTANYFGYQVVTTSNFAFDASLHFYNVAFVAAYTTGTWTSATLDTGTSTTSYGALTSTFVLNNGTVSFLTRSSTDGSTWGPYLPIGVGGQIASAVHRYLQVQFVLTLSTDFSQTPQVEDLTANWVSGVNGHPKYPAAASFTFQYTDVMLDIQQELADNLGGDTSIINDAVVQAQPLILTGASTDTVFQGTTGTPPAPISGTLPLNVTNGQTIIVAPIISGGMDTSGMSGASPSAAVVTFGSSATGAYSFTSIHPTRPVLTILITHSGTITDLRIIGKIFSNATYLEIQQSTDATSIAKYGDRQQSISNKWIVSTGVALTIAEQLVANFKNPISYIPALSLRPTFSAQVGDRVTLVDLSTDIDADFLVIQMAHEMSISLTNAQAKTDMTLLKIPV